MRFRHQNHKYLQTWILRIIQKALHALYVGTLNPEGALKSNSLSPPRTIIQALSHKLIEPREEGRPHESQ